LRERLVEAMLAYPPYRFPLERALADDARVLDGPWIEHIWQVDMRLGQPRNRVEEARTFFYRLADEAGLGTYRRGVRGQTTRLELAPDFDARLRPIVERRSTDAVAAGRKQGQSPASVPVAAPAASNATRPPTTVGAAPASTPTGAPAPAQFESGSTTDLVNPSQDVAALLPGLPQGISIQIDMTDWDLERIEAFLRLIGYLPPS
jgi:hypothetical protein